MASPSVAGTPVSVTYDDKSVRLFLWATIIWGIVGMLAGIWAAFELAWWPSNLGQSWLTFGRIRPLHTNAVIFAFGGNAIFCSLYYSLQRLLKTRMFSDTLSAIHFWGWQFIIVCAALTLPLGITQGKEYAELAWPIDILIALVWVVMAINVFGTIAIRKVQHLYVAIWFYLATIITITMLHVVNSLVIPFDLFGSFPVYAGVQDALVQWWYGHNAVGFFLTTPFLGLMYYFLPKAAEKPVFSYRLSIIHFWSLVFIYIWTGPHHLLYTSLPEWAQSLGMAFSLMLIAPSWGGMLNGLLTLRGAWNRVRHDPILKFFVMATTFYGMSTLEGPLMSIKSINMFTHYTDYTIGHVHSGALGWVGGMVFGMVYWLAPRLWRTKLYSTKLANLHFWTATIGIIIYVTSMWAAGITQSLMWFATTSEGLLKYPQFLETVLVLLPLYWIRLIGGLLYFTGAALCIYNIVMTARQATSTADETVQVVPERIVHKPTGFHETLEVHGLKMAVLVVVMVIIGGMVEIIPTFMIESNIPTITAVKPYTPLELQGRDTYVSEGCYTCHSQMIRTIATETLRYGEFSKAGEFVFDRPFQWGSRRTGPDLHRVGGKYPDFWHYRHMIDPRSTSPGSVMPAYTWLEKSQYSTERIGKMIGAMRHLGVDYPKEWEKDPTSEVDRQANEIVQRLSRDGVTISPRSDLVALIAYLQRLGTDIKNAPKDVATSN